jgi:hypothetical protein
MLPRRFKGRANALRMGSTPLERWFVFIMFPSSLWGSASAPKDAIGERSPSKPCFKGSFQVIRVPCLQLIILPPPNQVSELF